MTFHQLSFSKLVRLNLIGACIILMIYLISNDINNANMKTGKLELPPFHNNAKIERFDVGQGEDFWILTEFNEVM